jgi:hypothetical protein
MRRLRSPLAITGGILALLKPIIWLVNEMSTWDFLANNTQAIGAFLATGWGTLVTVMGGFLLIALALLALRERPATPVAAVAVPAVAPAVPIPLEYDFWPTRPDGPPLADIFRDARHIWAA